MKQYLEMLRHIRDNGRETVNRTSTDTISVFGYNTSYCLRKTLPVVTTKKIHLKSVVHELIWMLSGSSNIKYLRDNKVRIWDEWADSKGELGPVYGQQWRRWEDTRVIDGVLDNIEVQEYIDKGYVMTNIVEDGHRSDRYVATRYIDQIKILEDQLRVNPFSRRHILTAWNVGCVDMMALPPCHTLAQFYVTVLSHQERLDTIDLGGDMGSDVEQQKALMAKYNTPLYGLSCKLYQRKSHCALH